MSKGYPDFFGQSIFLQYGTPSKYGGALSVPAGATVEVLSYLGKGILYSMMVTVYGLSDNRNDNVGLYIDGNTISYANPRNNFHQFSRNYITGSVGVSSWNYVTDELQVILKGPLSFSSSVKIEWVNRGTIDLTGFAWCLIAELL